MERETAQLGLAQRAVARWAAFPVDAEPRPVVLAQHAVASEAGFTSAQAKEAWFDGSYEWRVEVPAGVRVRARQSTDSPGDEPTKPPLAISRAGRGQRDFLTDRGSRTLPAYWLKGPCINGSLWVLDPQSRMLETR